MNGLFYGIDAEVHRPELAGKVSGNRGLSNARQAAKDD
jgi:hypothetical protein